MNRKTTYIPVSNVRFAAMAAIIFVHSFFFSFSAGKEIHTSDIFIIILSDAFKFGTLCFFLISGYLLSVKLDEYDSREFLTRRARTIAAPWLTWSSLLVIALAIKSTLKGETWNFSEIVKNVVFTSEYWFVLNYFIALILILTFRSIKHSIAGIIFASLSIFYSANIYLKIIPTIHTTAIFGYLFFLWFGRQVRNKNNKLINRFMETNRWKLVLLAITLYGLSVTESFLIKTTLGTKYESPRVRIDVALIEL